MRTYENSSVPSNIHYLRDGHDGGGERHFGLIFAFIFIIFIIFAIVFTIRKDGGSERGGYGGYPYPYPVGGNNIGVNKEELTTLLTSLNTNNIIKDNFVTQAELSKESIRGEQNIINTINANQKELDLKEFIKSQAETTELKAKINQLESEKLYTAQFGAVSKQISDVDCNLNRRVDHLTCDVNRQFDKTDCLIVNEFNHVPKKAPEFAVTRPLCVPCEDFRGGGRI